MPAYEYRHSAAGREQKWAQVCARIGCGAPRYSLWAFGYQEYRRSSGCRCDQGKRKSRAFQSLEDYCSRLDSRSVNRKLLENLVRAGAFDFTGRDRAELFGQNESALAVGTARQKDRLTGQVSLFG